jgi:hypothetical protein
MTRRTIKPSHAQVGDALVASLASRLRGEAQILDEAIELPPLVVLFLKPQQIGRVHGDDSLAAARQSDEAAAIGIDAERFSEQPARRRRAERHRHGRLNDLELVVEPPAAGVDLACIGLLVQAPLAARLVLEVLHRIGDVDLVPVEPRRFQRGVQHRAGRPHEGPSLKIFLIAGLFADQHKSCIGRAFAARLLLSSLQ